MLKAPYSVWPKARATWRSPKGAADAPGAMPWVSVGRAAMSDFSMQGIRSCRNIAVTQQTEFMAASTGNVSVCIKGVR